MDWIGLDWIGMDWAKCWKNLDGVDWVGLRRTDDVIDGPSRLSKISRVLLRT